MLVHNLEERLTSLGWSIWEEENIAGVLVAIRPGDNGVLCAVEVTEPGEQRPDKWPVDLVAQVGVGFETALRLVTSSDSPVGPILVQDISTEDSASLSVSLNSPADVAPAVNQIVDWAGRRAGRLLDRFRTVHDLDVELGRQREAGTFDTGISGVAWWSSVHRHLVLRSAMDMLDDDADDGPDDIWPGG